MSPMAKNPQSGLWGQPTSTLDWCEKNYEVSPYVAEFWNTISNVVMIVGALRGFYDVHTQGFEKRFHLCFASLLIVGIGSWMFHMTLQYEMQLLDELPMVWGGCILAYCMHQVQTPARKESKPLALFLAILSLFFTCCHMYLKQPIIHFISYGFLVALLALLDMQVMKKQNSRKLTYFYALGFLIQLIGALFWLTDNMLCDQLEATRSSLLPNYMAPILQLHAWWHVCAGYATYMHILFCICHRQVYLKRGCQLSPNWLFGFTVTQLDNDGQCIINRAARRNS